MHALRVLRVLPVTSFPLCIFMQTHALGLYFLLGCTAERNQISRSGLPNNCRHHETSFYQLPLILLCTCWNKHFWKQLFVTFPHLEGTFGHGCFWRAE